MKTVIFACVHNIGRSQMAAAFFNAAADPSKARAISAGTAPRRGRSSAVVEALREIGLDVAGANPQKLTAELAQGASLLITMGCGDNCPVVPGWRATMAARGPDPKGKPVALVREIRDEIQGRVQRLLAANGWAILTRA